MSILRKNKPVHPLHREWTWKDEILDFWLTNKPLCGIIIILTCICILIYLLGMAAATGHVTHIFSTEANTYEHLDQVVCCYGGRLL